nr:immunoglobulin light chain junction region [Macaca mulatta]MOV64636.1 immunoglobulin light chain junction region [Macaca mulatta]
CMQTKQLPWTF